MNDNEYIEYRDYDREDLDRPIERSSIFMENVKNGRFTKINNTVYQKMNEIQKNKATERVQLA